MTKKKIKSKKWIKILHVIILTSSIITFGMISIISIFLIVDKKQEKEILNKTFSFYNKIKFLSKNQFKNDIYDFKKIKQINIKNNKEEVNKIIKSSTGIIEGKYLINDDWEMEPSPEIFNFKKNINWNIKYNEDIEMTYTFSRLSFIIKLCKSFIYTNDIKYINKAIEIIKDFKNSEYLTTKTMMTTWRTIDSAIRLDSLLLLSQLLQNLHLDFEWLNDFILLHVSFLYIYYDDWRSQSNWGIFQNVFLLKTFLIYDKNYFKKLIKSTNERLKINIRKQFDNQGNHWEQATMYHNELVRIINNIVYMYRINLISLDNDFLITYNKMNKYTIVSTDMNQKEIPLGDSDKISINELIETVKYLGGINSDISFEQMSEDNIFHYSKKLEIFPKFEKYSYELVHYKKSRNSFVNKKNFKLSFNNGTSSSGHAHGNLLHFNYDYKYKNFFIDPGRYTYKNSWERINLKNMSSHNTIIVNNNPVQIFKDQWETIKHTQLLKNDSFNKNKIISIIGSYKDQINNCEIERKILINEEKIQIFNSIDKRVNAKMYLVLDPNVKIKMNDKVIILTNDNVTIEIHHQFSQNQITLEKQIYSPKYNVLKKTNKIVFNIDINTNLNNNCLTIINN